MWVLGVGGWCINQAHTHKYTGGRSGFSHPPMLQPMALKGIFAKVFDLSISIACFIAHIFYAVYAQNSAQHARLFGFTQGEWRKGGGGAFSVYLCPCIGVCPAALSKQLLPALRKNRNAAHYAR